MHNSFHDVEFLLVSLILSTIIVLCSCVPEVGAFKARHVCGAMKNRYEFHVSPLGAKERTLFTTAPLCFGDKLEVLDTCTRVLFFAEYIIIK